MPQASLNPGVGTFVEDALAPQLADGSDVTADANGAWTKVDRPWPIAVVLETGTVVGAGSAVVYIEAADDASGTNLVTLGAFGPILEADDDEERILRTMTHKPYVRVRFDITGTLTLPATVTVRDKNYRQNEASTA